MSRVKMTGHYFFISFKDMLQEIVDVFNSKRGDMVPEIVLNMHGIPSYPAGIFDYGYETSCYKAILLVLERLKRPVSGGGAGEYYDVRFRDDPTERRRVYCEIFPFGSRKKG